jgi:RNA polymerase subunit RPABC4/transcription elongation factor Spt4
VILAPVNAEVYINDERRGSIGSSGRVVLSDIPPGRHILRVSKAGERDDERVIEINEEANEQVIQAQLRPVHGTSSQPSPSQGTGSSGAARSSVMPGIVACTNCSSRFAEGVKFCGRCGNRSFVIVSHSEGPAGFSCPRCSAALPSNSRFCGRCGLNFSPPGAQTASRPAGFLSSNTQIAPRQAERVCRRCGGVYAAHIRFCGRCGTTLL